MKSNLRTYYLKLLRDAKRVSQMAKDPTVSRPVSWELSQLSRDINNKANFIKNILEKEEIKMANRHTYDSYMNEYIADLVRSEKSKERIQNEVLPHATEQGLIDLKTELEMQKVIGVLGPMTFAKATKTLVNILEDVGIRPYYDDMIEVDIPINKNHKSILLLIFELYPRCKKIMKNGSRKSYTRSDVEAL